MTERSIAWVDEALCVIDQRALPHEWRELKLTTVDDVIDAIKTLAIRGAPAIGVSAAFAVAMSAFMHNADHDKVSADAIRIVSARPTAVNLAWAVKRVLTKLPDGAQAVLDEAQLMLSEDEAVNREAATRAADLVQSLCGKHPLRILTHCNTGRLATTAFGTAIGALRVLHSRNMIDEVFVDETRPLLQGARLTTWELAEAGIPHRLQVDSAAAWAIATERIDCVLVGADRITEDGSVANKIGTYGLALAAHHHNIPFIVVAGESTRDHISRREAVVVEQRAAHEVIHIADTLMSPQNTAVFNPAFDVTPAELITAVVTEHTSHINTTHVGKQIATTARELYNRGWMPGTSGNISVRSNNAAIITASGLPKGKLSARDVATVTIKDAHKTAGACKPSAETAIHCAIYRNTTAAAIIHVHPPYVTARSVNSPPLTEFRGYELIKGLTNNSDMIQIPVFDNHHNVSHIAADVEHYLREHPDAAPALMIVGHGMTTWGATLTQARDRAECLEAVCQIAALTGTRDISMSRAYIQQLGLTR